MIYKRFKDTELFERDTTKIYEYNIEDHDINYCIVDINGRYPKEKWAINHKCKEMAHIISGSGILVVEGKEYQVKQDDVVLIDVNEKYYWNGNMRLGIPCTPAWYPEQYEDVD